MPFTFRSSCATDSPSELSPSISEVIALREQRLDEAAHREHLRAHAFQVFVEAARDVVREICGFHRCPCPLAGPRRKSTWSRDISAGAARQHATRRETCTLKVLPVPGWLCDLEQRTMMLQHVFHDRETQARSRRRCATGRRRPDRSARSGAAGARAAMPGAGVAHREAPVAVRVASTQQTSMEPDSGGVYLTALSTRFEKADMDLRLVAAAAARRCRAARRRPDARAARARPCAAARTWRAMSIGSPSASSHARPGATDRAGR